MCLIIDANCAVETLCHSPSADFAPVMHAIQKKGVKIVLGGAKLREEYARLKTVWHFVKILDQAGKVRMIRDVEVDTLQAQLEASGTLVSDDPHIIALALVAEIRLLCSKDQMLHIDFLSHSLIKKPRGKVYQNAEHSALLRTCCH